MSVANVSRVVAALLEKDWTVRDLSEWTGINHFTVRLAIKALLEDGTVEEKGRQRREHSKAIGGAHAAIYGWKR